jgi:hypothetical protein
VFLLWAVFLSVIFALLLRKVPASTPRLRFRHGWLVLLAISIQILIFTPFAEGYFAKLGLTPVLNTATYAIIVVFTLLNRKIASIAVIGLGTLSNLLVITANKGYMPVKLESLRQVAEPAVVNIIAGGEPYRNSVLLTGSTPLPYLADIFYLPAQIPLANVFSVGDVVIGIGAFILVQQLFVPRHRRFYF